MFDKIVRIMLILLLVCALVSVFNIQPIRAEPSTIIVPDDYPTILEAINASTDNTLIIVKEGMYIENIYYGSN